MYCKLRGKDNVLFDAAVCEISDTVAINLGGVVILEEVSFFTSPYIVRGI